MATNIALSICTYKGGGFDVIIKDTDTGDEVTLSGTEKVSEEDFKFLDAIAPACVFTKYTRVTPGDY